MPPRDIPTGATPEVPPSPPPTADAVPTHPIAPGGVVTPLLASSDSTLASSRAASRTSSDGIALLGDELLTPPEWQPSTTSAPRSTDTQPESLTVDRANAASRQAAGGASAQQSASAIDAVSVLPSTDSQQIDPRSVPSIDDGSTPNEQAEQATQESLDAISAMHLNEVRTSTATSDSGQLPHKFKERPYSVFHHDAIVYIQGADVSEFLEAAITVTYNLNKEPNSCDIVLNNAMNRFILTPENFDGIWRVGNSDHEVAEYDESAKKHIFDIKNALGNNPVDTLSGGRMWPLDHWSPVFHQMDPVRVWIRNPIDPEVDEWLPVFTGYIATISVSNDYIRHGGSINLNCKDLRMLMQRMRVNTNSVLFEQPGQVLTEGADNFNAGARTASGGGAFDPRFFESLVVLNEQHENPWANMNLWQVIRSLTYGDYSPVMLNNGNQNQITRLNQIYNELKQSYYQTLDLTSKERIIFQMLDAQSQIDRATNPNVPQPLPDPFAAQRLRAELDSSQQSQILAGNATPLAGNGLQRITGSGVVRGRGRIGRMRRGKFYAYPKPEALQDITERETTIADENLTTEQQAALTNEGAEALVLWNNIVAFGYPNRVVEEDGFDANITDDTDQCRYWTYAQVRAAGELTRSNRAWAPDVQMVHVLKPAAVSSAEAVIQDNSYISNGQAVSTPLNWTSRLDLLDDACSLTDYRFYITGSGDLVFEFPQFDFYPRDYNRPGAAGTYGWKDIYEFNTDLIEDQYEPEVNEVITTAIAVGTVTGHTDSNLSNPNGAPEIAPQSIPHAICYSPVLTGRLGAVVRVFNYPLLTEGSESKLALLAALELQKSLGHASMYAMTTAYRPWVNLNRPVYNQFRARLALTESVSHTIPVRESSGAAATHMTLAYPRNFDQFGVPKFITGGSSLPVYFGNVPSRGSRLSTITSQLGRRAQELSNLLAQMTSGTLTAQNLEAYRTLYGAPFVSSYDFYNVINVGTQQLRSLSSTAASTALDSLLRDAREIERRIADLASDVSISGSARDRQLTDLVERLDRVNENIAQIERNVDGSSANTTFGWYGIRTPRDNTPPESGPVDQPEELCDLDNYRWSSPLGKGRDGTWPRRIIQSFSQSNHQGVDYAASVGENVYAVGDGTVEDITDNPLYGRMVKIRHESYFSVYASINASVAGGQAVKRNQVIGTVRRGPEYNTLGSHYLHFALGTDVAQPPTSSRRRSSQFFDPPSVFPVRGLPITTRGVTSLRNSFAQNRGGQTASGASATRVHGGFDIVGPPGSDIVSATSGHVVRVYTNTPRDVPINGVVRQLNREGFGVLIQDTSGARHGYFHFESTPLVAVDDPVSPGTPLGKMGGTGAGRDGGVGGVHLHYQIEIPGGPAYESGSGVDRLRVDAGPRLAALWSNQATVSGICRYEAENVYGKESGQQFPPRQLAADASESPVAGKTVDEIWQAAGFHGRSPRRTAPAAPLLYASYLDTQVGPNEETGVPFSAPAGNITNSSQLRFALLGTDYTSGVFRTELGSQLATKLGRSRLNIVSFGEDGATIDQWLETPDQASTRRRTRSRTVNTSTLQDIASEYNVILVNMFATSPGGADLTTRSISTVNTLLSSSGALVIWLLHPALPPSSRSLEVASVPVRATTSTPSVVPRTTTQSIQDLLAAGVAPEQADPHLISAVKIRAAGVSAADATPLNILRIGTSSGYDRSGNYTRVGANTVADALSSAIVTGIRHSAINNAIAPETAAQWASAVPPEDCPPSRQRRLQSTDATNQRPIPAVPAS